MSYTYLHIRTEQNNKICQHLHRTTLSLIIGTVFCTATVARADCVANPVPNIKGGVDMICEGTGILQDIRLLGNGQNNNVIVEGNNTTVLDNIFGANSSVYSMSDNTLLTGNTVTLNDNIFAGNNVVGASITLNNSKNLTVTGNSVTLNDNAHVVREALGAYIESSGTSDITVAGNSVTLNDNAYLTETAIGGAGYSYHTGNVTVSGNSVTFNNNAGVPFYVRGGGVLAMIRVIL